MEGLCLKFWGIGNVGVARDCPKFFDHPYIIPGTGRATHFKFGRYIHRAPAHAETAGAKVFFCSWHYIFAK